MKRVTTLAATGLLAVGLTAGTAATASAADADCVTSMCGGGPSVSTGDVAEGVARTGYDGANEWCADAPFACSAGFFAAGLFTSWVTG